MYRTGGDGASGPGGASYAEIITALSDGVAVVTRGGTIAACNPAGERILGIRAADMIGRPMLALPWRIVREDETEVPREEHPALVALETGVSQREVVIGVRRGDSPARVWVSVTAEPVRDSESRVVAVVSTFRDVTESIQTVRALRESESRFRALFTRNGVVQLLIDAEDGCVVHANAAADAFYGHGPSGLLGRSILALDGTSPEELSATIARVVGGEEALLQRRHRLASGEERDVAVLAATVTVSGRILIHAIIHDVTARVRAERAQGRLAAILDQTPDLVAVLEPEHGVVYVNRACRHLLGLAADAPIPHDALMRLLPAPALVDIYERGIPAAIASGAWTGDVAIVGANGEQVHVSQVIVAHRTAAGELEYVATIMRDISERKAAAEKMSAIAERLQVQSELLEAQNEELTTKTEELAARTDELTEAQQFQNAVLEHVAEGIVACDQSGSLTVFNRAAREFHGIGMEPITPERWAQHYDMYAADGETRVALDEIPLYRALRGDPVSGTEVVIAPKEGSVRTVEVSGRAIVDAAGRKRGAVIAMHDITERKVIDRMKNEFIGMVSHELRTPLTSIRGSLGLLEAGVSGELPDQVLQLVRIARQNSDRLVRLISNILDVEKIEAGKMELTTESLAPAALITAALDGVRGMAEEMAVTLVHSPGDATFVSGDRDRLLQVLTNLLSNAIKFSPVHGTVYTRAEDRLGSAGGRVVRFSVEDNGAGIASSDIPHLFKKFQQLGVDRSRRQGGTGLGLAISRALVEQHGGRIGVESSSGGGSLFWFEVPVARRRVKVPSGKKSAAQ
ncbi:MAG: hypothetical protein NVS1B4_23810 [Gemmatimonadaceae bacterium]